MQGIQDNAVDAGLQQMQDAGRLDVFLAACSALMAAWLCWLALRIAGMRMASSGPPPGSLASLSPQGSWALHHGAAQGMVNPYLLQGLALIAISLGLGKAARASFRRLSVARRDRGVPVHCVTSGMGMLSEEGRHDF